MNLTPINTVAGWAVIGGIAYAIFGPRRTAREAVLVAGAGVGVGVVTTLLQAQGTSVGTGALPATCACRRA